MSNKTTFILPDGSELPMEGLLNNLQEGRMIHIDHPEFGEDPRRITEIVIRCKTCHGRLWQTMQVFLA